MSLLNPWAFSFLAIVPVIVLLYLLKIKRLPATVSTLMFWQRVVAENRRRSLFQKLRHLLSLLLHLLIFLLILFALARPEFARFLRGGSSTVLILDTRARMQAIERDGTTRFDKAKKLLAGYARHASSRNQMTLLTASSTADVAVPFTPDERTLQQGIAKLEPTDAGGDLDAAIHLAEQLLASRSGAKNIVVFTDRPVATKSKVEWMSVGGKLDNVAITRFAARPIPNSRQTWEVLIEIRNFSDKPAQGNAEIYLDGNLVDVKPFQLAPNGVRIEIFPSLPQTSANARGWLTARLDVHDALPVDNEAFALIPPENPMRVLLVTKGNWFIEKMLAADETLKFEMLTPDAFRAEMAANFDAVILDDFLPDPFDLQKARGNFLFIKQTPFAAGPAPLEQPLVTDVDSSSPLLRFVNLKNVTIMNAAQLRLPAAPGGWRLQAPLRSFDHPLLITGERRADDGREQRVCALAFEVAQSDLPLRVAFPLLMSNTLQWLAGEKSSSPTSIAAGQPIELAPDESIFVEPQKTPALKPGYSAMASNSFRPLKNGFYLIQRGSMPAWIAVNTFSESESDLRAASSEVKTEAAHLPDTFSSLALGVWPLWNDLALAAFALFFLEWWLYHRRRTE
jgi:hypothetical protein